MIRFFVSNFLFFCLSIGVGFADTPVPCDCERTVGVYALSHTVEDFESLIVPWLSSSLSGGCVKVVPLSQVEKPEYILSVHYEQAEDGYFPHAEDSNLKSDPFYMEGTHRRSALSIGLFTTAGLVEPAGFFGVACMEIIGFGGSYHFSFGTETIRMSLSEHKQLMLSKLQKIIPFTDYLEKYEQIPKKVQIKPEKEEVLPGEVIEIEIPSYTDKWGEKVKGNVFLRTVIKAEKGLIRNAEDTPYFTEKELVLVFQAEYTLNNPHKIKYMAPWRTNGCESDFEDTITFYNSCNIYNFIKVSPLEETECREEIKTFTIKVKCPRGQAFFTRSDIEIFTDEETFVDNNEAPTGYRQRKFRNEQHVTVKAKLRHHCSVPRVDEFWDYYMLEEPQLMNEQFIYTNIFHSEMPDSVVDSSRVRTPQPADVKPQNAIPLMIKYNNDKREKLLDVMFGGYTAIYAINTRDKLKTISNGEVTTDEDNTFSSNKYYGIDRSDFSGSIMDNAIIGENTVSGKKEEKEEIKERTQENGLKTGYKRKEFRWNLFLKNVE